MDTNSEIIPILTKRREWYLKAADALELTIQILRDEAPPKAAPARPDLGNAGATQPHSKDNDSGTSTARDDVFLEAIKAIYENGSRPLRTPELSAEYKKLENVNKELTKHDIAWLRFKGVIATIKFNDNPQLVYHAPPSWIQQRAFGPFFNGLLYIDPIRFPNGIKSSKMVGGENSDD